MKNQESRRRRSWAPWGIALVVFVWSALLLWAALASAPRSTLLALAILALPLSVGVAVFTRRLEARELSRQLEVGNQRMDRFALAASHELRNPLAAARAYLELAGRHLRGKDDVALGHLEHALREVDRIWLLVEGLLVLARANPNAPPFESKPIAFDALLSEVLAVIAPVAALKQQSVEHAATSPLWVLGDRSRLYLALFKLCDNAVRFTPRGGTVRISTQTGPETIVLEIDDEGPGISERQSQEVFNYFEPGEPAANGSGSSLGLSLVQRVALSHGGRLSAQGRPSGGSRFTLTLPRATPTSSVLREEAGREIPSGQVA